MIEENWEDACINCGRRGVVECDCCGQPLCGMCAELGANFCDNCLNLPKEIFNEIMHRKYYA